MSKWIYHAPEGFLKELQTELTNNGTAIESIWGDLILAEPTPQKPLWCQNIWSKPQFIPCPSITKGAAALKELSPTWSLYSFKNHRRASLISDKLNTSPPVKLKFLQEPPAQKISCWSLIEPDLILASTQTESPFPQGEFSFFEDKNNPPSRAYLKLWELFTVKKIKPPKKATVLDLGSCPGGWTWVLQQIGCQVVSVDKAPIEKKILNLPNVQYIKKDAFTLRPTELPQKINWLFSDIICYPERLLELHKVWKNSVDNFVFTIKFKGETDYKSIEKFRSLPNSQLFHLHHNKHELTWVQINK